MENTKFVGVLLATLPVMFAWTWAHTQAWEWLLGNSGWALAGTIVTSVGVPLIAAAVVADLLEKKNHG